MPPTKEDLLKVFESKKAELRRRLKGWFDEETAAIDGIAISAAPSGSGGSIIGVGPAIDSKRVVDATIITEKVLNIELPPAIIRPGGYDNFEQMISDLVPKLQKVFIGELKVKKRKSAKALEAA